MAGAAIGTDTAWQQLVLALKWLVLALASSQLGGRTARAGTGIETAGERLALRWIGWPSF